MSYRSYKATEIQNKELKSLRRALADSMRSALLAIDEMEDIVYSGDAVMSGVDDSSLMSAIEELKSANDYIQSATNCTSKAQTALRQYQMDTTGKSNIPEQSVMSDESYASDIESNGFRRYRRNPSIRKTATLAERRKAARRHKEKRLYGAGI